jgi:hypothetical protein
VVSFGSKALAMVKPKTIISISSSKGIFSDPQTTVTKA